MLQAIGKRISSVRFYEVDYDLSVPSLEWLDKVEPNDLVIAVDYFGFPCNQESKKLAKEQGAWVLEDACQALLSEDVSHYSDFVLYSPRKFLGVADGGILVCNHEIPCERITIETLPPTWWLKALSAMVLRREFDLHGSSRRWVELFRETEAESPVGFYGMSELSALLLRHSFDYRTIAQKRVENYLTLTETLEEQRLFPVLQPGVVPLGFPIRVKDRDRIRQTLFDHEIYPPVHWPVQGIVPEEFRDSHKLADEIMTLPCDQRYDQQDMKRMAGILLKELK
jgi:dTDP-4-amino-4,6-dideoxygalactose transaminase